MRPALLALEGPDGCGKSTQAARLHAALVDAGHRVELHREPTDSSIGVLLRCALTGRESFDAATMRLLFAADRQEHSSQIETLLASGVSVVCDRYALSNAVYAFAEMGYSEQARWAAELSRWCVKPALTVVLEAPIEVCAERMRERGAPQELYEARALQERVHSRYRLARAWALESRMGPIVHVDARGSVDEVAERVWAVAQGVL